MKSFFLVLSIVIFAELYAQNIPDIEWTLLENNTIFESSIQASNFPNPFNSETEISFFLMNSNKREANVSITYFYYISDSNISIVKKMVLIK